VIVCDYNVAKVRVNSAQKSLLCDCKAFVVIHCVSKCKSECEAVSFSRLLGRIVSALFHSRLLLALC